MFNTISHEQNFKVNSPNDNILLDIRSFFKKKRLCLIIS